MSRFDLSCQQDSEDNTGGGGSLPSRLKAHDQWLVTQGKRPVAPSKGWQESVNLLAFTEAQDKAEEVNGEVAFCFAETDPFIGFDLDDVMVDGEFTGVALGILRGLDSYTEISRSVTGFHVIAEGNRVSDRKTRANLPEAGHLEVYDTGRYFVLTGDVYDGRSSIQERQIATQAVQVAHLPIKQTVSTKGQQKPLNEQDFGGGQTNATPEQVRRTIRAYVKSGSHDVDREVLRLWEGSDEGRRSASEADMAFVKQLYYWCKGDQQLMDKCFRASDRLRSKWDDIHSSDGATYGEMTIRKVCRTNSDTFGGRYVR